MRNPDKPEKKTRPLWMRLLDGMRALVRSSRPRTEPASETPGDGPDHAEEGLQSGKRLLVVIRNDTSLDRVLEVLHAVGEDVVETFVIDVGSAFAGEIATHLRTLGCDVITWNEAKRRRWGAIYAAHVNNHLAELNGPLLVTAHGVSYNRLLPTSTGGDISYPVGLSPFELMSNGRVFPAFIGLGAPEQLSRMCPEARDRAVLVGDPVYDKLAASTHMREKIRIKLGVADRKLVLISSTWGSFSTFRARRSMIRVLMAVLPRDEYVVALVAHPNIWTGESPFALRNNLADELDSGLLLIDSTTWQAALVAADLVIGDHGSVTNYAVGLGLPVLLASNGEEELHPASPVAWLHAELPQLDHSACLRTQIELTLAEHDPARWRDLTQEIFGLPGQGMEATVNALRFLMNEPPLRSLPASGRWRCPWCTQGNR